MTTIEPVDGISDYICDGTKWILVYRTIGLNNAFSGRHTGQITGKLDTIEYSSTELEMADRATALGVEIPED